MWLACRTAEPRLRLDTSQLRRRLMGWTGCSSRLGLRCSNCDGFTQGQTALHWASVRGALPAAELLLRSGARLEMQVQNQVSL